MMGDMETTVVTMDLQHYLFQKVIQGSAITIVQADNTVCFVILELPKKRQSSGKAVYRSLFPLRFYSHKQTHVS